MSQNVTDRDDQGRKRWPEDDDEKQGRWPEDDESKHWYHRNNVGCALLAGIGLLFVVLVWLVLFPIKLDWNPTPIACPPPFVLGIEQLNARASLAGIALAGTYTYQPVAGTVLNPGTRQLLSVTFVPSHLQLIDWLELIVLAAIIILAILLGLSHYSRQRWSDAVRWGMLLVVMLLALALVLYALSFKSASATVYLDVPKTTTIYWSNPAPITEGTPLSAAQLNAIVDPNVPGVFTYTPGEGTVLPRGTGQPLTVTFNPNDTSYCPSTMTVHIDVTAACPITPVITWANPADVISGTKLSAVQLNATANLTGSFTYAPPAGTILLAGSKQPLTVTFTPTEITCPVTKTVVYINVTNVKPPACARYHVVRCGETLFSIGRMYGVNPWDIAAANHLPNPNQIFAGQRLCIPPRPVCRQVWCGCGPYRCGW
jgi:LysM repeat protein/multisubunit Na+/H+ antiporter MnhB subunit